MKRHLSINLLSPLKSDFTSKRSAHNNSAIVCHACRFEDAESMLQASATVHRLSVPSHSQQMYLIKATMGNFYKSTDKPLEAIDLLQNVVDHVGKEILLVYQF